jgi:hypothetical protein
LVPHGGDAVWSAISSCLVVNGSRDRSDGNRSLLRAQRRFVELARIKAVSTVNIGEQLREAFVGP